MVLNADLGDDSLKFTSAAGGDEMAADSALISGGQTGDDHASFEIQLGNDVGRTSNAVLAIPSFGISSKRIWFYHHDLCQKRGKWQD